MPESAWINLAGVAGQLFVAAFFFGMIRQSVTDLLKRSDRMENRMDTHEVRLNDLTERTARLETAVKLGDD